MAYGIDALVQDKVDAYRGQPQVLQQKYAQNQELLDLLALQKLKSEKEAAARQMQLQMAQQQAAQGQAPTIKDQREQEVLGLTKQELAQQTGGIAQQQQQDQQKKMQQLIQSGIASAPAPNMARMAGGGIVAFAGEDGSYVSSPFERATGLDQYEKTVEDAREKNRLRNQIRAKYGSMASMSGFFRNQTDEERANAKQIMDRLNQMSVDEMRALVEGTPPPDNRALLNQADAGIRSVPVPTPTAPSAPAAAVTPPAPAAPVPGTVARPPAPPTPTAGIAGVIDPFAKQKAEEERVAKLRGLTPEQRKVYDEGIAELRNIYKEETDPEARRSRELSAFLRGAANRSSIGSVMAGASAGMESERRRGVAQRLKGTEAVQKKLEDVIGIERGAVGEGIQAGQEAGKLGGQMRGQDIQSRDRALDREVEQAKVSVQAEANAALRDQNNFQRLQTTLGTVNRTIAQIAQNYAKSPQYGGQLSMLQMQLQGAKGEDAKKVQDQITQLSEEMNAVIDQATADLIRQRDALEAAMGGGADTGGFTVRRKQ